MTLVLTIPEHPGRCRWCGCDDDHACDGGCSWVNGHQTLCSACVPFDRGLKSGTKRRELATIAQVWLRPVKTRKVR